MTPRRIVLCVDDAGLHASVDAAVLALFEARRVSAVSGLVDGPSWAAAAAALRERAGDRLEVGLHLNLTEPLRPGAWQRPLPWLLVGAYARTLPRAALRAAMQRQFDGFERGMQRRPDFVDGHQHVQQLPLVREVLLEVLAQRAYAPRPWLRVGLAAGATDAPRPDLRARTKARVIAALGARRFAALARAGGYRTCHALLGVRSLDADAPRLDANMRAWLAAAADADVLMTHPARDGATRDPLAGARATEFALLTSERFGQWLEHERIRIATMTAIVAAPQR
jgi:predicted glycoside hydrolase/deacetylase ChbG (UPF0249 family)